MAQKRTKKEEAVETPATQEVAPQEAAQGPELSIQDLVAVRNIIDIASQRGAFRAGEMEPVGRAFNKLNAFLEAALPKQEEATEEA